MKKETMQEKGGKATVKKYGKKYMQDLGRKGAIKRWAKAKKNGKTASK